MSRDLFNDDCTGCRPMLFDMGTGKALTNDDPVMRAINRIWDGLTRSEKEAFHRFCCLNSRAPDDLLVVGMIKRKFEKMGP